MQGLSLDEVRARLDEFLWPEAADSKQRAKREAILGAATARFVASGYRKTSVDEVARQAGVAKGTVYLYYRNKAELLFHAAALEKRGFLDWLVPLEGPELDARDRLQGFVAIALAVSRRMPLVTRLSQGDREIELVLREVDIGLLNEVTRWQLEFLGTLIEDAAAGRWPAALVRQRAALLSDLIIAVITAVRWPSETSFARYASEMAGVLVDGVLGEERASPHLRTVLKPVLDGLEAHG